MRRAFVVCALAACAKYPAYNSHSGDDGVRDGAGTLDLAPDDQDPKAVSGFDDDTLDDGAGDSVDWKLVSLPAAQHGALDVDLSWEAEHAGVILTAAAYDEHGGKLAAPDVPRRVRGKTGHATFTVDDARGKVYLKVRAINRGDAASYEIAVAFHGVADPTSGTGTGTVTGTGTGTVSGTGTVTGTVTGTGTRTGSGSGSGSSQPPSLPASQPTRLCPDPAHPTRLVPDCLQFFPACDRKNLDPQNPNCDNQTPLPPDDILGNIQYANTDGSLVEIGFDYDPSTPVSVGWKADVLDPDGHAAADGSFTITRVDKGMAHGRVRIAKTKFTSHQYTQVAVHPPIKPPPKSP